MKYFVIALCIGTALARPDGAGGHHHDHSAAAAPAPSSGYQEPAAGYSAPASGYEQPAYDAGAGYSAPSAGGYDQSGYDTGYTAPEAYAPYAPATTEPFLGFGLGWVTIPIIILLGIFLLFPSTTVVPVTAGRRKRGAEDGELHKQLHFNPRVSRCMHSQDHLSRHPVSYIIFIFPNPRLFP